MSSTSADPRSVDPKSADQLTELLRRARAGDGDASSKALERVYGELRRRAEQLFDRESSGHTLQPTALVHEAWLKLRDQGGGIKAPEFQSRAQFFHIAVKLMREILVDCARKKNSAKHGGNRTRMNIDVEQAALLREDWDEAEGRHAGEPPALRRDAEILAVHEALEALHDLRPRAAQVAQLKFFGGCTIAEMALALEVSPETVKGDWSFARAWLRRELDDHG
ncbi:MAG: sigma-70 family RNA polymerase sigma factor [Planctomycetes bacterium]|nr:sigma-70 family RNA polymerase sigma factor [Planctomycetota bacterium]